MAWDLVKHEDKFNRNNTPFVSISNARVCFSGPFVRIADIDDKFRATIFTDSKVLSVGFEFHTDKRPNSLSLGFDPKSLIKKTGLTCSSQGIVSKFKWVYGITTLAPIYRRFTPQKEGRLWVIKLCPSFENCYDRESPEIPRRDSGIYQYVSNGKIVYIGRGNIIRRLKSFGRDAWEFDSVEYSVIENKELQIFWETYWIDKFKESEGGLPFYNKISGFDVND
jgi:hypothetical protein